MSIRAGNRNLILIFRYKMSHTVLRGQPAASQLYLDSVLDVIINDQKKFYQLKKREELNLGEIIYHCMKTQPDKIFMIDGSNGNGITNGDILKIAVPLTRALQARDYDKKNKNIIIMMRNSQYMACVYYAALFAGVVPLIIDANSTAYEIRHFIDLVLPHVVFCDEDRLSDFKAAAKYNDNLDISFVIANDGQHLKTFYEVRENDNMNNFLVSNAFPDSTAILLPTSGSTGLPKATELSHRGLIAQLPVLWIHHKSFPHPTEMALLVSSAQWMTHTILMTTCPVYGVKLLMTSQTISTEHVLDIINTFKPTWALLGPAFAQSLAQNAFSEQLDSLKTVIITGAPLTRSIATVLENKLSGSCYFGSGVGMTETHGFFTMPGPKTSWDSNDKIINTCLYKLIDECGKECTKNGELLLKSSSSLFKAYYKNAKETQEAITSDGWLLTGDIFYVDNMEEVHFMERKKLWFKYLNYHISPVELENVISSVGGVKECVVCESENGPAAAVVLQPDFTTDLKNEINEAINSTLSDYKQLRGGIAFVSSLPYTHSGKIKRAECKTLIQNHIRNGDILMKK